MATGDSYGLYRLQDDVVEWANTISPNRKPQNTIVKLVAESSELLDAVINGGDVRSEIGDMVILLLDIANMYGIDIIDAGWDKMDINRHQRKWVSENGVIRRIKDDSVPNTAPAAGQAVADLPHKQGSNGSGAHVQRGNDRPSSINDGDG